MSRNFNTFLIYSLFCLSFSPAIGEESCSREAVCLRSENDPSPKASHYFIQNRLSTEVTATLEPREIRNMESDIGFPLTLSLPPFENRKVGVLRPLDTDKKWSHAITFHWKAGPRLPTHDDQVLYKLPYAPRKRFVVTKGFDEPPSHQGLERYSIDWAMPEGTEVRASRGGFVADVEDTMIETGGPELIDKTNFIWILHSDGTCGTYAHLRHKGVIVQRGAHVREGDVIGYSGNTGYSTSPHLHFSVIRVIDGKTIETVPIRFTTGKGDSFVPEQGKFYRAN